MSDINKLRKQIRDIDDELIALIGKRMSVAKQVGQYKFENDLPVKNFQVEKNIIEDSRSKARKSGFYEDLAEDFTKLLIRYSVMLQEEFHSTTRKQKITTKQTVGVVGGCGRMGLWMAQFFESFGHRILLCDTAQNQSEYDWTNDIKKVAKECDVIVLSTPISATANMIRNLAALKPKGLIFDICSLKTPVKEELMRAKQSGLKISSVHPMFGPDLDLLSGQNIIVCDLGDDLITKSTCALFENTTASVFTTSLEKHDQLMSYVLGLSHMVNLAFAKALSDSEFSYEEFQKASSSTFHSLLDVVRPVVAENQDLYYEIQTENQFTNQIIETMMDEFRQYLDTIKKKDRDSFKLYMEESRQYLYE